MKFLQMNLLWQLYEVYYDGTKAYGIPILLPNVNDIPSVYSVYLQHAQFFSLPITEVLFKYMEKHS